MHLVLLCQKITAVSLWPRPEEPTQVDSTDLGGRLEGRCGPPGLHGSRRAAKSSAPHHEAGGFRASDTVVIGRLRPSETGYARP